MDGVESCEVLVLRVRHWAPRPARATDVLYAQIVPRWQLVQAIHGGELKGKAGPIAVIRGKLRVCVARAAVNEIPGSRPVIGGMESGLVEEILAAEDPLAARAMDDWERLRRLWRLTYGPEPPGRPVEWSVSAGDYRVWSGRNVISGSKEAVDRTLVRNGLGPLDGPGEGPLSLPPKGRLGAPVEAVPPQPTVKETPQPTVKETLQPTVKETPQPPVTVKVPEEEPVRRRREKGVPVVFGKMYDILVYLDT